jgi:DNA-binding beta-propeller fold protein YncE
MYVSNAIDNNVSVIDTTTNPLSVIDSPIPVGEFLAAIAYDPVNHRMYVTNMKDNTISDKSLSI